MPPIVRVAAGFALCAAAGAGFLPRPRSFRAALSPEALARAAALGLAALSPALLLFGLAGVPIAPATIAAVALLFAAITLLRDAVRERAAYLPAPSLLVPAGALAVFAWKVAVVPLWSWDHHMVWGMKSRVMIADGLLDLSFLRAQPFAMANADYPLGLPMAWRVLTLGAMPSAAAFKICHVLFGIGVVLAVRQILREAGVDATWSDAAAAFTAVSPLFWDTESLGLAEMPLCWIALIALGLLLRLARGEADLALAAGVALGMLPWIKKEGASLALLILAAAWFLLGAGRRRRLATPAVLFAVMWIAAIVLEHRLLLRGLTSFFAGDWSARVRVRLADPLAVLTPAFRELVSLPWIAFGIALAAAAVVAVRRRDPEALTVFGVVLGQALLYLPVYFATYLDPAAHVRASLSRLAAALLPLGALAFGLSTRGVPAPSGTVREGIIET